MENISIQNKPETSFDTFIFDQFTDKIIWKFSKMIINGNDNTLYAINDRFCLYKNGETTLLSDGILFEGQWICDNKTKEIHLFLFSKYSNEQSGMGYKANYEIKIKGKIEKITDFETRLKGICNACIEEHNYGTLPVLPSITEMVYPVLWELIKL